MTGPGTSFTAHCVLFLKRFSSCRFSISYQAFQTVQTGCERLRPADFAVCIYSCDPETGSN